MSHARPLPFKCSAVISPSFRNDSPAKPNTAVSQTPPGPGQKICGRATSTPHAIPPGSTMDEDRDLAMGQDLDRLAAEDDRGDTVAAVGGHDD
jgi:hypothetical protein